MKRKTTCISAPHKQEEIGPFELIIYHNKPDDLTYDLLLLHENNYKIDKYTDKVVLKFKTNSCRTKFLSKTNLYLKKYDYVS